MNEAKVVTTVLRIPGNWAHPGELVARLPAGFRLTPAALVLPDGTKIEITPMPPDDQFAQIFQSACRLPATEDETAIVNSYTVNIVLAGAGGSMRAAVTMMQAGAAIVHAGGAGVFIDNSAMAHGGGQWLEMAEDASPDAVSFAFVSIIRGRHEVRTLGMHVLGMPDVVMRRSDIDSDGRTIIEIIRYLAQGHKPIGDGHLLADEAATLRFQARAASHDEFDAGSPMHNPFGRFKLVSMKDIAENN